MSFKSRRVDDNQLQIIHDLLIAGVSILDMHELGHGAPDICCGVRGKNYLFEIKNPEKDSTHRALTLDEKLWHETWRGHVKVIETAEEALEEMGML